MKIGHRMTTVLGLVAIGFAALIGCGGRTEDHATDTKTNWLSSCEGDDDCDDGLACLCGVCTVDCATNSTCEEFGSEAGCFHAECVSGGGVCALPETPLEQVHVVDDGGRFQNCPKPASEYSYELSECETVEFTCVEPHVRFDDDCGCGCEPGPECDPDVEYVGFGEICGLIDYDCPAGEEHFTDDCGCGCKPSANPTPTCTQPADNYIADAEECANTDYDVDCAPGVWFSDACGCGCTNGDCDETVDYVAYGDQCEVTDFQCEEGEQQVTDDCGCGCKAADTQPACPRVGLDYDAIGDECDVVLINCEPPTTYFRDDCGCGCEPNPACDANVGYVAYGECEIAETECAPEQKAVVDECGCGCAPDPTCDPDATYVIHGCAGASIACGVGELLVVDECGCGCKPNPACDPDVEYVSGSCDNVIVSCPDGGLLVEDDCGCGCKPNPACDPDVEYRFFGGCAGAIWGCGEGEMVVDDCGCGCRGSAGDADAGTVVSECPEPEGTSMPTEVIYSTICAGTPSIHDVVTSSEEFLAALEACGAAGTDDGYQGEPLYVATVAERTDASHMYTIDTGDAVHVGIEYPAYCSGAAPPTVLLVFAIAGLSPDAVVVEDVCNTGECSGPPPP